MTVASAVAIPPFRPGFGLAVLAQMLRPRRAQPRGVARAPLATPAAAPGTPDPDLLRRFRAAALPLLDDAYSFARYLCRDEAAAEDIVHDAYLRAMRGFAGFHGGEIKPWLFAIIRNCFHTWAASRPRTAPAEMADEEIADLPDFDAETPESALIRSEEEAALRACIAALPVQYREVLVLREIDHLSYREIAAAIDAPTGTVMSRLARGRLMLAAAWRDRLAEESA
jgi:RNA polymerase sigma-70 factor (ECF subfamily)